MKPIKILNLDEFEEKESKKAIRYQGRDYQFTPFTVDDYIKITLTLDRFRKIEEVKAAKIARGEPTTEEDEVSIAELYEYSVGQVTRAFPELTEKQVRDMPVQYLAAITDYIEDKLSDVVADEAEAAKEIEEKK